MYAFYLVLFLRVRLIGQGTWKFISCHLANAEAAHWVIDERESCLWVLMWITLRYSKTDLSDDDVGDMLRTFDDSYVGELSTKGGRAKMAILMDSEGEIKLAEERSGLYNLIERLRESFTVRYLHKKHASNRESILVDMAECSWLRKIFQTALAQGNWPDSDKSLAQRVLALSPPVNVFTHFALQCHHNTLDAILFCHADVIHTSTASMNFSRF